MELSETKVVCVGIFILDVLGRPISEIPPTQNSLAVEEIRLTAAGTAGGTSVDLARLGLATVAVGAIGDDDTGIMLRSLLERNGVDVSNLVVKPDRPTSTTMLAILPDGSRRAWHQQGASGALGPDDIADDLLSGASFLHLGGLTALPELDGEPAADLLRRARLAGATTTADCLGVKRADAMAILERCLPFVDVFLPNDEEAMAITDTGHPIEAARMLLGAGPEAVVVTCGVDGCIVADDEGIDVIPAYDVPSVDSTGCGDAVSAGVIAGLANGWSLREAVELGSAAAALTVQGLGSDAGVTSFDITLQQMRNGVRRPPPKWSRWGERGGKLSLEPKGSSSGQGSVQALPDQGVGKDLKVSDVNL